MSEYRFVCDLSVLDDPGSRGFSVVLGNGETLAGFVVRRGDRVWAYADSCPHTGVELAWLPDQYLDADGMYIQCALHGALFTLESGYCVRGPCAGQSLAAIPAKVVDGRVLVSPTTG
jgi:nitrite reductase/ring-hydroxylating ferredoxin subunit